MHIQECQVKTATEHQSFRQSEGRVQTPMIDQFLARYRAYCESYQTQHPHQRVSTQFDPHAYDKDIDLVNQF